MAAKAKPEAHPSSVAGRCADIAIAAVASRQHGVVSRRQLLTLGCTRHQIQGRATSGRLHRLHRGVYAVGHRRLTRHGHWMAAVLSCGPGALLSHRSAAALWGILAPSDSFPDVTVRGARPSRNGLRIHRARGLTSRDHAVREAITVTAPARTIVDLAVAVDRRRLERAVEAAERLGLFDLRAIDEVLSRSTRRPGSRALRSVLSAYREPAFTRSELERRFLELVKGAGLPSPSMNASIAGHEVDALWLEEGLVVELDGYESHRTRAAFERDRRRDEELLLAGLRVIRLTAWRIAQGPQLVTERLRAHLDRTRRHSPTTPANRQPSVRK